MGNERRVLYFNNSVRRDHVGLYGRGAFFDLKTAGPQSKQARDLLLGQECVVATPQRAGKVRFGWFTLEQEDVLVAKGGLECRVFFGRSLLEESHPKALAAQSRLYGPLFNVNGHFKRRSVVDVAIPFELLPDRVLSNSILNTTAAPNLTYTEGSRRLVQAMNAERSVAARSACIRHYGTSCAVCGMCFSEVYGPLAEGFIHVHHLSPLADCDTAREVDPVRDLRPVCANCHAVIHLGGACRSLDEVRVLVRVDSDQ